MRPPKISRVHPKCQDLGCRSVNHLVCPAECELLHEPPTEDVLDSIPLALLIAAPIVAIT
jgi:hypothetical protein